MAWTWLGWMRRMKKRVPGSEWRKQEVEGKEESVLKRPRCQEKHKLCQASCQLVPCDIWGEACI